MEDEIVNDTPNDAPADVPSDTPNEPVIPDGFVRAEEVETERTARTAAEQGLTAAETRAAEAEAARVAAETARAEAEAARVSADARVRAAEIREAARELNFNDPSDAERFISADATDFRAALEEVIKSKTYLVKPVEAPPPPVTPTSPTNPARTATLTRDAVKNMTPKQIAENWDAVKVALAQ